MKKVIYPTDKRKWSPSLIPGPVVLISTYGSNGEPNIAPKSWIQMVSFDPPILMFSGTRNNTTEKNVLSKGCFAINIVDSSMASNVYESIKWFGKERIEKGGFRLAKSEKIDAPLIDNCKAHLECELRDTKEIGGSLVIFGEIVAASISEDILKAEKTRKYEMLDQIVFLEDGVFAKINSVLKT